MSLLYLQCNSSVSPEGELSTRFVFGWLLFHTGVVYEDTEGETTLSEGGEEMGGIVQTL